MRPFLVFLLGALFGFLAKWMIDFLFWRERYRRQLAAAPTPIRVHVEAMPAPEPAPAAPKPARASKPRPAAQNTDDLKAIKGIGPVIERKLNEAGIRTFEQLAALKVADLQVILGKSIQRLSDEDDLLKQARRLARKK